MKDKGIFKVTTRTIVAAGLGAALLLCALAAIGPAVAIGRTEPLALLQQGRGAF